VAVAIGLSAAALLPAPAAAQNVETDPVQCWWRTSSGAVRIGESFSAVLTCAVIDTPDVKVVVDESRLEPSVAQFAPFEVLGGTHAADLRSGERRFFQYEYRMRLLAENMFGKDAALPETKLSYRVQSRVSQRTAMEGRDQTYLLPPLSMRILSLVPADASDIRDASAETFADVDGRAFRASLLTVIGGVLFALAGLVAVLTLVRLFMRARQPATAAEQLVGDGAILRGVGRELAAVQRERESGGWSADLAARALAALRIVGTYALGRRAARVVASRKSPVASHESLVGSHGSLVGSHGSLVTSHGSPVAGQESPAGNGHVTAVRDGGQLVLNVGWPRRRRIAVSGAATPQALAQAIARSTNGRRPGELESIQDALSRFTVAQYGRPGNASGSGSFDDTALDESLRNAQQVLKRLQLEQTWIMRRLGRSRQAAPAEMRAWSR
jgi:hypothetical protein